MHTQSHTPLPPQLYIWVASKATPYYVSYKETKAYLATDYQVMLCGGAV